MAKDIKDLAEKTGRLVGKAVGTAASVAASTAGAAAGVAASAASGAISGAADALVGRTPSPKEADPMAEEMYWREHFAAEPYFDAVNYAFEDYLPAWRTGWEGKSKYAGRRFDDVERELKQDFHWNRGQSRLLWEQARDAVRAAFERVV
jgi:hypothetical protein